MTRLTNPAFAEKVQCDFTTASRLRQGQRRPSLALMARIWKAFDLDGNEIFAAYLKGRAGFTEYLNRTVFDPPEAPKTEE